MNFTYCQMKVSVAQSRKTGRYQVQVQWCPGMDEMWEIISHAAQFANKSKAERLANQIRDTRQVNLTYWMWDVSQCSPYSFMQKASPMKPYNVG